MCVVLIYNILNKIQTVKYCKKQQICYKQQTKILQNKKKSSKVCYVYKNGSAQHIAKHIESLYSN